MKSLEYFANNKKIQILVLVKVSIIIFTSFVIITNFIPFYNGNDSYFYAITTIDLANGSYGFTNELLKETGSDIFIPDKWVQTQYNTAIPKSSTGLFGFSTISFLLGSYYGLFFLGPLFGILLLIISERIATKMFGELAGLVTLILVSTDAIVLFVSKNLLTDNIFTVFFILGCFFMIRFFQERKDRLIFLSSILFVISTFVRINGGVSFPIEIFALGIFSFFYLKDRKTEITSANYTLTRFISVNIKSKKFFKTIIFIFIPWLIFLLFWFSFNDYYFGDPSVNYRESTLPEDSNLRFESMAVNLSSDRFEWIKLFSSRLLPDYFQFHLLDITDSDFTSPTFRNWSSLLVLAIFIPALALSFIYKKNRIEIIIFSAMILTTLLFYSARVDDPSNTLWVSQSTQSRYMIMSFVLTSMIFGFMMENIWTYFRKISLIRTKLFKIILKGFFLFLITMFLFYVFYESTSVQAILNSDFNFNNPFELADRYPLDTEGLSENSIIVMGNSKSLDYNTIPYNPQLSRQFTFEWNEKLIPTEPIEKLKKLHKDGYEIYTFKDEVSDNQRKYFQYLETGHGIILKEYSKTFCQMIIVGIENIGKNETSISDGKCYWSPKKVNVLLSLEDPN